LEAKGYGLKNSIANLMNQFRCNYYIRVYQPEEEFIVSGVQTKLEALLLVHITH
jgi:hypothetical protein